MPDTYNIKTLGAGVAIQVNAKPCRELRPEWITSSFPGDDILQLVIIDPEQDAAVYAEPIYCIPFANCLINGVPKTDQESIEAALAPLIDPQSSGGGSIVIPAPMIETKSNHLYYFFPSSDLTFLTSNAEIFLMRQSKRSHKRHAEEGRRRGQKWVHPSNSDWATKWEGWKFFGGAQASGETDLARTTEWAIDAALQAYVRTEIELNLAQFRKVNKADYDTVPEDATANDFLNGEAQLTGSNKRTGYKGPARVLKFCLVVAIDNPAATQENGLCPKIFGPMSEPFYTMPLFVGQGTEGGDPAHIIVSKDLHRSKNTITHV